MALRTNGGKTIVSNAVMWKVASGANAHFTELCNEAVALHKKHGAVDAGLWQDTHAPGEPWLYALNFENMKAWANAMESIYEDPQSAELQAKAAKLSETFGAPIALNVGSIVAYDHLRPWVGSTDAWKPGNFGHMQVWDVPHSRTEGFMNFSKGLSDFWRKWGANDVMVGTSTIPSATGNQRVVTSSQWESEEAFARANVQWREGKDADFNAWFSGIQESVKDLPAADKTNIVGSRTLWRTTK